MICRLPGCPCLYCLHLLPQRIVCLPGAICSAVSCCPVIALSACQLVIRLTSLSNWWQKLASALLNTEPAAVQHCPHLLPSAGCGRRRTLQSCRACSQCWSAPAGCAFVQYSRWAEAEKAIDAHNAKTVPPGGEVPLVVKFADARKKEPSQGRRGGQQELWQDQRRQMGAAMPEQLIQVRSGDTIQRHGVQGAIRLQVWHGQAGAAVTRAGWWC